MIKTLAGLHRNQSWDWARSLVELMRQRTGLLVERELGVFAFPHRTFQEYLAGVHLALSTNFVSKAVERAKGGAFWREVILLAVGYKVHSQGEYDLPVALVNALCPKGRQRHWRLIRLAGDALLEIGPIRVERQPSGRETLQRVRQRLTALVEQGQLNARGRAETGDVLGELGDPRFEPDLFYLPCRYRGKPEPLAGFVEIPPGSFVMGEGHERQDLRIDYPYWIPRYPVTVAQFGAFIAAGGYETQRWWTTTGWSWRQGGWDSQVEEDWLKDWLKSRPIELRGRPMWWDDQRLHPNRPVMGVSWFEAVAYCRWLDDALRHLGKASLLRNEGYNLRLPSEAEWEKAARGGDARRYPWGDEDWDAERANIFESEIGDTTPVGMYPRGRTPLGLHDLSGNVWEWTLSLYRGYPYHPEDGRNELEAEGSRVLRGGSWLDSQWLARGAYRLRLHPDLFNYVCGFRVVLSLVDAGF